MIIHITVFTRGGAGISSTIYSVYIPTKDSVASIAEDSRPRGVVPIVIGNLTIISPNSENGMTDATFTVT